MTRARGERRRECGSGWSVTERCWRRERWPCSGSTTSAWRGCIRATSICSWSRRPSWCSASCWACGCSPRRAPAAFDGNPKAQAALGLSERELEVLHELAAGHSNKEIAAHLHVSPNTVKTHVARLFEKLGAKRRTEAIRRARELGIVP